MTYRQSSPYPSFSATCELCGQRMQSTGAGAQPIYARASGEPFKAYACEPCASAAYIRSREAMPRTAWDVVS